MRFFYAILLVNLITLPSAIVLASDNEIRAQKLKVLYQDGYAFKNDDHKIEVFDAVKTGDSQKYWIHWNFIDNDFNDVCATCEPIAKTFNILDTRVKKCITEKFGLSDDYGFAILVQEKNTSPDCKDRSIRFSISDLKLGGVLKFEGQW